MTGVEAWPVVSIGDVTDLNWGDTKTTKASYAQQGFPAYSATGFDGFLPWADFDCPGVVISAIGAQCGKSWLARGKWSCIKNTLRFFSTDARADTAFLYWATRKPSSWPTRGSAQPFIAQADARLVKVRLPPVREQRAIAAMLGALDDKIESNRRLQQTAAELAQALVGSATCAATETGYEDTMSVVMGSAFKGESFSAPGTGRPLLRIRDLKTFVSQTWTTEVRADETVIQPGDIVVGMDAEFRATLWQGMPSLLNQRVCAFRPHDGVSRAFVLSALAPQLAFFEKAKSGTTVIHLNKADIDRFLVPLLDNNQHAQLTEQTEQLLHVVVIASAQSVRLAALRDALLPELLSGRIRVPEAGAAVESAPA